MATLASQFVTVDGCRLEYRWHGPPASEAPTIVFLHEGLGSISRWRDFPESVCARMGWGGLVYNRQGYGGSDPFRDRLSTRFMHREALDVLPRLLETFEIAQPVLFGHSDGGSIALIYAGSGLGPPSGLVLEAPHVFVEDLTLASIRAVRASYRSSDLRARLEGHHGSKVDILFNSWAEIWLSDEFRNWSIEGYLPAITCPTLVIQGRDDEYGTPRQVNSIAAFVSGRIDTLLVEACRHSPHIDQREAAETAVVRFLERLDPLR